MIAKRRGQSAAFMARIRKLRGKKKKGSKTSIKSHRRLKMAKRKAVRRVKRRSGTTGLMQTGLGIGGYILFESMIEPKIIQMANITNPLVVNAVELAGGIWLVKSLEY